MEGEPIRQMLQRDFTVLMLQFCTELRSDMGRSFGDLLPTLGDPPPTKCFRKIFPYRGEGKQEPMSLPSELDQRVQIIQVPKTLFL